MIGKQSIVRPTALGLLLSSSAYGSAIPEIFGTARSAPIAIWAANLREHGDSFLDRLTGHMPTWVENVDMIVGGNPISGVLQVWSQQSNEYPLEFCCFSVPYNGGGSIGAWAWSLTIGDPNFYAVVAVTAQGQMGTAAQTFNDYGSPGPVTYYTSGGGWYEMPLWNAAHHGPALDDPNHVRFPAYKWSPSDGPTITTPVWTTGRGLPMPTPIGTLNCFGVSYYNIYYARTVSKLHYKSPLAFNRFNFEASLGSGTEYSDAGLSSQQRGYPHLAGVGSSNMDCGTGPAMPSWRFEVQGQGGFLPSKLHGYDPVTYNITANFGARGDAEFADMIEHLIRSGMKQYGTALGYVQNGANCGNLPGPVQKDYTGYNAPSNPTPVFYQPNTAGSILIGYMRGNPGYGVAAISDTAGNTWVQDYNSGSASPVMGIWHVNGCLASPAGNTVTMNGGGAYGSEGYILEMDPGSNELDGPPVIAASSTAGTITATIKTSAPGYVLAIVLSGAGYGLPTVAPQWTELFPAQTSWTRTFGRRSSGPGVFSFQATTGSGQLTAVALFAFKTSQAAGTVPYPKALGNIIDYNSLFMVRLACRVGGLQGSLAMDSQRSAAEWLKDICTAANCWPVWSGQRLKFVPRSEVSQIGDGSRAGDNSGTNQSGGLAAIYYAPTSTGPVANLTEDDLIGDDATPLIKDKRTSMVSPNGDNYNVIQVQHFDRSNKYNQALTAQPEAGSVALDGPRKAPPMVLNMIVDPAVARRVAAIEGRRKVYLRNTLSFKAKAQHRYLEAGDLITVTDSQIGINQLPVRITQIVENEQSELEMEAERYLYGLHAPQTSLVGTVVSPYNPDVVGVPANVNTPIIFEPPLRLCLSGKPELWLVVSDSDTNYGGCAVFASTDGGATYPNRVGVIQGNATTGALTADFPPASDPDITDTLSVDLTESLGLLNGNSASDESIFKYPLYLASAAGLYELAAYEAATLAAPNKYNIVGASGNPIRRAVLGMPTAGAGVDHPNSSRFAWLDDRENASPPGILKLPLDPSWIGKTIYFKFVQFNTFQQGQADISTLPAYSYTPAGVASGTGGTAGSGGGTGGSSSQPAYSISGGALTQPTTTTIAMAAASAIFPGGTANYAARTFTITAPTAPTTYYVTIYDPGQTGEGSTPTLSAQCLAANTYVGVPGYVYIGSIIAMPGGGGGGTNAGGYPPPAGSPLVIGFVISSGISGTNVGPELAAPRLGTINKCKVVVKAADATTNLTFKIKKNGTDVFSTDPTVPHATAAGTVLTFTSFTATPLAVILDDVFTIDISSGSAAWQFTVQLES